jgi:polyphenol oxidase
MPVTNDNLPITYDGIATKSTEFVLAAQGADCPAIFLFDSTSRVISLVHAGWKPLVRGVVKNTVDAMVELGAERDKISACVSAGSGDQYTAFR